MAVTGAIGAVQVEAVDAGVTRVTIPWTSDVAAGSVGEIPVSLPAGTILRLRTVPGAGADAPTDNYDVTLLDAIGGADVLGGAGVDRDTANVEIATPTLATYFRPWIPSGTYYPTVVAAGNSNTGVIELLMTRSVIAG